MRSFFILLTLSSFMLQAVAASSQRPNIIFILADDLGWADVGWHGGEIRTPHLDKLADGGAKLEPFYVLPVCSPTRAALMTRRYLPFNAPRTPLQEPDDYVNRCSHIADKKRQIYAAMIECLDEQVGRVVSSLEARGVAGSTLIVFSSDNGGLLGVGGASNGKLRAQKGTLYEGGTRVCALANWPGQIKPGTVIHEPLHIVDWFPTLVNLAGGSLDQKQPLDGRDTWHVVADGKPSPHEDILINAMPNSGAIRMGGWKLVLNGNITANELKMALVENAADSRLELFNLADDPYEQHNLAEKNPGMVQQLRDRLDAYRAAAVPPKAEDEPASYKAPRVWGE